MLDTQSSSPCRFILPSPSGLFLSFLVQRCGCSGCKWLTVHFCFVFFLLSKAPAFLNQAAKHTPRIGITPALPRWGFNGAALSQLITTAKSHPFTVHPDPRSGTVRDTRKGAHANDTLQLLVEDFRGIPPWVPLTLWTQRLSLNPFTSRLIAQSVCWSSLCAFYRIILNVAGDNMRGLSKKPRSMSTDVFGYQI